MKPILQCSFIILLLILGSAHAQQAEEELIPPAAEVIDNLQDKSAGAISSELSALIEALNVGVDHIRALNAQLESVPESDREAVKFRRDERSFEVLQNLDQIAKAAALLPEEDPGRVELTRMLKEDFARVTDLIFDRAADLNERIARFEEERDSLSGTERFAVDSYLYTLRDLRIRSYSAVADVIESRRVLGLDADEVAEKLVNQLYVRAETLVGRIKYLHTAVKELQPRLNDDPGNTELSAAIKEFSSRHKAELGNLRAVSKLIERVGQDNSAYKTILVQQGDGLSVRDFDRGLVASLLSQWWLDFRKDTAEKAPDRIFNLVVFLLILFVFRLLSKLVRRGVVAATERSKANMSTLLKDVLASVSGLTVMLIGIMIALSQLGISIGPMLAGLGVAGFIVGFALQDTLANFAAGGMILLYRPYDVDDFVEVAGASGLVKKMSLVSTTINTFDNQTLVVPNSKIWGDVIKNVTAQRIRRVDMMFGISYGSDIEQAERLLGEILSEHEQVLSKPEAMIKVHELGDSSVNIIVRPWVRTADYWNVYWDITREVKMRFDREGISIPFPQRDVHLYSDRDRA